eukprot:11816231-Karenia_brevis.AAC.1
MELPEFPTLICNEHGVGVAGNCPDCSAPDMVIVSWGMISMHCDTPWTLACAIVSTSGDPLPCFTSGGSVPRKCWTT